MYSYTYDAKKAKRIRKLIIILIIFASLLTIILIIDGRTRPVVRNVISAAANREATMIINRAVAAELKDENLSYYDMVLISRDADNNVTSIETNITNMNLLKSKLNLKIVKSIEKLKEKKLQISLGTLTGNEFFSARGPKINYYIEIHGFAETAFVSSFEAVGINQTRHRIYIEITANLTAYLPGYRGSTTVKVTVIAAETVIVGKVPAYYSDRFRLTDKNIAIPSE